MNQGGTDFQSITTLYSLFKFPISNIAFLHRSPKQNIIGNPTAKMLDLSYLIIFLSFIIG